MKRKLFNVALAVGLVCSSAAIGAVTGRGIPDMSGLSGFGSPAPAGASSLTVEPKGPIAPLIPTGTGFTYQGSLKSGGNPVTGSYDFVFTLYDAASAGNLVSSPVTLTSQTVTGGLFTVSLDFGSSAFDGNARYLELAVRIAGGGSYTTLSPRQPITPAPYALFALKTQPYKSVVTVAQSGGQFTSITTALNSITDASTTNRYLVWVGPGTYTETVTMKQYVDIEGSGQQSTRITSAGSSSFTTGTLLGASNAELRSLTVQNTGGAAFAVALYNNAASPSLLNVTLIASGGSSNNVGASNNSSSPSMTNAAVSATGAGVANYGMSNTFSSPRITSSVITATGGTSNYGVYDNSGGPVTILNSKITGSSYTIYNEAGTTTQVSATQLSSGPVFNAGSLSCSASYDGNNRRLGSQCTPNTKVAIVGLTDGDYTSITAALNDAATWCGTPSAINKCLVHVGPGTYTERVTMVQYIDIEGSGEGATRITFTGSGSDDTGTVLGANNAELRSLTVENTGGDTYAVGIYNYGQSPSLLHVTVTASGAGTTNYGVYNYYSSVTMTNVTASASGGATYNLGVYNNSLSSPTMTNVTASASGATYNYGVQNNFSSPRIVNSTVSASAGSGGNYGIYNIGTGTVTIDDSRITGSTNTIANNNTVTTKVGASQLLGGPVFNSGTLTCSASYDGNNKRLGSQCTPDTNTVNVATTGGDFTSITAALNSITDNSSTNRYLVKVGPGTYSEQVTMKQWVDIEGSGEDVTKITFTGSASDNTGTVVGAYNAELRSLAVENTGGNAYAIAIYNTASTSLLHVTATASGGSTNNYGMYNLNSSSTVNNVTFMVSGPCSCGNIAVGNGNSIVTMNNVTAVASGGSSNYAMDSADNSIVTMNNVTAIASGGRDDTAVWNIFGASTSMNNVTASASGGSFINQGVYNQSGTATIMTSVISASGATRYGVYNSGGTVTISGSKITGSNFGSLTCTASLDGNNRRLGVGCSPVTLIAVVGLADSDYTSITAALNDTATWCGTPSATNKCLVRVGPGTYNEHVTMAQYVDIEGSGEDVTKITFTGSASENTGTVVGASNAELRFLTVENTGGNTDAIAIYNNTASPSLLHITAIASGASTSNIAVYNSNSAPPMTSMKAIASGGTGYQTAVFNDLSSPTMINVTAIASGGSPSNGNFGVSNSNSSPRIVGSIISASGGSNAQGVYTTGAAAVTIDSTKVSGSTRTIFNDAGTFTRIGASQLSGGPVLNNPGGTLTCVASYNGSYAPLNSSCQ